MTSHPRRTISVISTVLNEGESITRLLDSLVAQTRPPDEVVIVDGGSTDDTLKHLNRYAERLPLRILVAPGANISEGRNRAIRAAQGEIIAATDAGVQLAPNWLEALTAPFDADPAVQIVAGFFLPDPQNTFERAMGATVLPLVDDIDPERFLPSSRSVAFTREAWEAVGGYPEWLDYCEDLIFDFRLRDRYGPFAWAPDAVVYFRPRSSLKAFFVQYYRYARGDGKADLWRKRHAVRYGTYLVATPLLAVLGATQHPLWWGLLFFGGVVYCRRPWQRLRAGWADMPWNQRIIAAAWVPVIRAVGDVAKMIGYPVGWWWRLRHWSDPRIHWR
ncbi:MAG: glycosyltransferase [Anaerolineae bacterium]